MADALGELQARNEVRVLASLDHPNIVKYYETFVDEKDSKLQIVMELCEVGCLFHESSCWTCVCPPSSS